MVRFELLASDGNARRGVIHTRHGPIQTPGFFAVATRAALKGVDPDVARSVGTDALIVNSYHLEMQPGSQSIARAGGLHGYIGWDGPLATDSGGFQVFSLRHGNVADELKGRRRLPEGDGEALDAVRVDEEGADFRSYVDGSRHRFTPESSMELQRNLGADILFTLDECTPFHVPPDYTRDATHRNLRWAIRCLDAFESLGMRQEQALYGIVHGGVYPELRMESARAIAALPFAGFGIGDCLGETKADWYRVVDLVCPALPIERPRHLLGVGEPDDMIEGALRGIDTFDCAMPTRIARHGQALHPAGRRFRLDLGGAAHADEPGPIEDGCDCRTCRRFSRAYLRHLLRSHELLGYSLIAEHNLRFVARLLGRIRQAIEEGQLEELRAEMLVTRLDPGGR
jgi:queuine tRNA-ribosyltransferase